jgi:hypothetical protein
MAIHVAQRVRCRLRYAAKRFETVAVALDQVRPNEWSMSGQCNLLGTRTTTDQLLLVGSSNPPKRSLPQYISYKIGYENTDNAQVCYRATEILRYIEIINRKTTEKREIYM